MLKVIFLTGLFFSTSAFCTPSDPNFSCLRSMVNLAPKYNGLWIKFYDVVAIPGKRTGRPGFYLAKDGGVSFCSIPSGLPTAKNGSYIIDASFLTDDGIRYAKVSGDDSGPAKFRLEEVDPKLKQTSAQKPDCVPANHDPEAESQIIAALKSGISSLPESYQSGIDKVKEQKKSFDRKGPPPTAPSNSFEDGFVDALHECAAIPELHASIQEAEAKIHEVTKANPQVRQHHSDNCPMCMLNPDAKDPGNK